MANILLTWEFGWGMGHLMNLRPIAEELVRRGHSVFAALRDVSRVREVWGDLNVKWFASPVAAPPAGRYPFDPPRSYAQMLGNAGFISEQPLNALFARWNRIFDEIQPNLVIADHSPTVLFSLRDRPIPRSNVGLAFFCPPDCFPLPCWPSENSPAVMRKLIDDEYKITNVVNGVLQAQGRRPILRLSQLFNEGVEVVLATYAEFDAFGPRANARYWGHWPFGVQHQVDWPDSSGPRIYSYLKPSPELDLVLGLLKKIRWPSLIASGGIPHDVQERYASDTLRFVGLLDLRFVAHSCNAAITNAGHGTVATLLLGGKPCVVIPLSVEQALFARTVESIPAGRMWTVSSSAFLESEVLEVVRGSTCRTGAETFAAKYAEHPPGSQIEELVDRFEGFLSR